MGPILHMQLRQSIWPCMPLVSCKQDYLLRVWTPEKSTFLIPSSSLWSGEMGAEGRATESLCCFFHNQVQVPELPTEWLQTQFQSPWGLLLGLFTTKWTKGLLLTRGLERDVDVTQTQWCGLSFWHKGVQYGFLFIVLLHTNISHKHNENVFSVIWGEGKTCVVTSIKSLYRSGVEFPHMANA